MYPWLEKSWQQLTKQIAEGRVPHALLISGIPGIGKRLLAEKLAHSLLCEAPINNTACGECRSCNLLKTQSHPDFLSIEPEEEGKVIKVATIRALLHFTTTTSQYHHHKVVIIEPADSMNKAASNSLLKTLEEPATRVVMILISATPAFLPATIRSRCQRLALGTPDSALASDWLERHHPEMTDNEVYLRLASGSPLRALELNQQKTLELRQALLEDMVFLLEKQKDPVSTASSWLKHTESMTLPLVRLLLIDMVRLKQAPVSAHIINLDLKSRLQGIVNQLDLSSVYNFMDFLNDSLAASGRIAVNPQLMLEDLLIRWSNIKRHHG